MSLPRSHCFVVAALVLLNAATLMAQQPQSSLELAVPFTNHMILQRQSPVPVWGWGTPGETVTVSFAGQEQSVKVGDDGKWMLKLTPLKASTDQRQLTVTTSGGGSITIEGVLVGEVWFSSGQSNMVWVASKSSCRDLANTLAKSEQDIPIREINIETQSALYPQDRATSEEGWKKSSQAGGFSALSLSFAHQLYQELGVPIGILLSAHSNTRIEAFTQGQAILTHPELEDDAKKIMDADVRTKQGRAAYKLYETELMAWQQEAGEAALAASKIPTRPALPGIAAMWRGPSQFYNGKIHPVVPFAIRGAIWCQGTSNGDDGKIYAARMEALVNGWRDAWKMPNMPFYFTQMQSYGKNTTPDDVGFGEIRQAQHQFFVENRENVGMVVQFDVNNDDAGGIHYFNKLHPGMRMARWALAKQYEKDIAFTGPIFSGYEVDGNQVVVSFEKESLFGGLMVGGKGSTRSTDPGEYVEPAKPTPGEKLNHFRLCGADKKWHRADAKIVDDTVVVTSSEVTQPHGVQYAYNAVPKGANLYNRAGLPATPFAQIDGQLILISHEQRQAELEAKYAQYTDPDYPILQVAEYYRDGVIIQRDQPIPVWGHTNVGETVTVTLGGVTKTTKPNQRQQWSVVFPPLHASSKPIKLTVQSTHGFTRTVNDILVGDVWYLTGSTQLSSQWPHDLRNPNAKLPEPMPLVREFKRRTNADNFTTPRKRKFENGGGKYRSYWATADYDHEGQGVTTFAYHFAKTLGRPDVPQGFMTMSSGRGDQNGVSSYASPLSWTGFHGVMNLDNPAFQDRLHELLLSYPSTEPAKQATNKHLEEVRAFVQQIITLDGQDTNPNAFPLNAPSLPEPGKNSDIPVDQVPTYAYNWCVSPHTPMAVSGVIWVPSPANIGPYPDQYAAEMQAYAASLPTTFGQSQVPLLHAQPSPSLIQGITIPDIPGAASVTFNQWPESLEGLAKQLAVKAK